MAGKLVEMRLLQTFVAVASRRNFADGGRRLGLSRHTVGIRIRLLEKRLGVRLFDRGARGIETKLTATGHELLLDALTILKLHDRIVARARRGEAE